MTMQTIYHRDGKTVLFSVEAESQRDAVIAAVRSSANLTSADLTSANLTSANLANAYLGGAYLRGADLRGAEGIDAARTTPLLMLLDQPGKIRAYKLVTSTFQNPMQQTVKLTYTEGMTHLVKHANTDVLTDCGAGINVATLDWCLRYYQPGYRVMIVEFEAADIAAIPTATDGKFRLYRCLVVGEKDISALAAPMEAAG